MSDLAVKNNSYLSIFVNTVKDYKKPIICVLVIILAIGALACFGCGLAAFGMHQHWWHAIGSLSHLNPNVSMSLMGAGEVIAGGLSIVVLIKLIKNFINSSKIEDKKGNFPRSKKLDLENKREKKLYNFYTMATQRVENKEITSQKKTSVLPSKNEIKIKVDANDKKFVGGEFTATVFQEHPNLIFKKKNKESDKKVLEEKVQIANEAREFCKRNNLYLLYVPESKVMKLNNSDVIVQEKMEFAGGSGSFENQQIYYEWIVSAENFKEYADELMRQLLVFVSEFGFGDVKYDNIPLTKDGRIALIDLDKNKENMENNQGLLYGGAGYLTTLVGVAGIMNEEQLEKHASTFKKHCINEIDEGRFEDCKNNAKKKNVITGRKEVYGKLYPIKI